MANKLTQAQERKLERQKQEIDNRKEIVKGYSGRIYQRCASLADPSQSLYLHRSKTQMQRLCHLRPMRIQRQNR